jgi:predicted Zn-ribbon and HTH transcriptional regulator
MGKKICIECSTELTGLQRKFCSNACKQKNHWYRVKEQQNTYHSQTIRAYKRKLKLIEMNGGGCKKCGYDKNMGTLQFHHRNASEKSFPLDARQLSNRKWETILLEHAKCELLCANCHSEHHHPEMEIDNVKLIVENHGLVA